MPLPLAVIGVTAIDALYIVAFALLIYGMTGLTGPRTAVRGNKIAAVGMAIAVVATLLRNHEFSGSGTWWLILLGLIIGTAIGVPAARNVRMTAMPQMVAIFNGVGGGAVALIAWVEYRHAFGGGYPLRSEIFEVFGAIVGSVSFWGSNVAFGKLQEILPGRPIKLPGRSQSILNLTLLVIAVASGIILCAGTHSQALFILGILVCSAILGNAVVLPIGGADMPVVISLLNAFTGLSAAATGVALGNTVMIVAGMIVGASGTILTNQMAKAMNRSVPEIVAGGFGGAVAAPAAGAGGEGGTVRATSAQDVAIQLSYARLVVIAPGYGMAVAQAQHAVRELQRALEGKGVEVKFAIHPVAGRMPGHMNVLLAEADVPYDLLKEMDEINPEFTRTDVTLVIGANDVTNPAAKNEPGSPIYGMPILEVDKSGAVVVLKRSMASGFAGIDNPLFYDPKTSLLFGDAKASVSEITSEVEAL
ncbi:MAG TPA: NAD(P)(+) transhydrogenase (Re/Si-specific) subunit beta [Solirubrobacteraceae bacterium]|jgi:NAD(P) transhydrogenase subunit beta|nr:NAD(P)(+) transhydrogenase (Re/Si-specific) subunit beta [Solirubrobacteraceae bacterium]